MQVFGFQHDILARFIRPHNIIIQHDMWTDASCYPAQAEGSTSPAKGVAWSFNQTECLQTGMWTDSSCYPA